MLEYTALSIGGIMALWTLWLDLRSRTVRLVPLLVLLGAGWVFRSMQTGTGMWAAWGINAGILTGILLVVGVALRLRGITGLVNRQIGIGDLILMLAAGSWFDPLGFAFYLSTGLLVVLSIVLILMATGKINADIPLPIAGLMAAYLLVFYPLYWQYEMVLKAALEN